MSILTVRGTATREVTPDRAVLTLGLDAVAEHAEEALALLAEGSDLLDRVLDGAGDRVLARRPSAIRVVPRHDAGPRGPILRGQAAERSVVTELRADGEVGELISSAVAESGARVHALQWSVDPDNPVHSGLRAAAVGDARTKAEDYADAAGMRLGPLRWLAEPGLAPDRPARGEQEMALTALRASAPGGGEPPILDLRPEDVRLSATVEASYELLPTEGRGGSA